MTIDLSQAEFDDWDVEIVVHTHMGAITVIVPRGLEVRPVGRSGAVNTALEPPIPGFPVVRLSATCDMGTIRVMHPTEKKQHRQRWRRRRSKGLPRPCSTHSREPAEAVREQADWLAGAGYIAVSVDLCFWGRPPACLLRMFRDLRAGRGQTFDHVDAARTWLAGQPGCSGRLGVIRFCATGGFAPLMAAGHGFSVSSVNYGLVRKDAGDALRGACPVVASFGAKDRFLRAAPRRLDQALGALGIEGHAFLSRPEDEPGLVAGTLA